MLYKLVKALPQVRLLRHFNFILILIIVSLGPSLGLASSELPSALLEQSNRVELSKNRHWLRLNHYKKSIFGNYKSAVRGPFFLSPEGEVSPEKELAATILAMFSDDSLLRKKTQCRYLARREFIASQLKIPQENLEVCEFSSDWMKRLGAQKISLVFASSFMESAGSSFGHTFLKLNNPQHQGGLELTDYGLNFSARTSDTQGAMYAINGLLGRFPGAYGLLPYHQMMKDYINLEGRDVWEYSLNLTPAEVQRLIYAVLEIEGGYFDYYFLDDNCSFQLLKLLEIARPELELAGDDELFVIPLDTVKKIQSIDGLIETESYRPSLQSQFRSYLKKVNRESQIKIKNYFDEAALSTARSDATAWSNEWSTDELDLAQLYIDIKRSSDPTKYKFAKDQISRARSRRGQVSQDQLRKPASPVGSPDSTSLGLGSYDKLGRSGAELNWRFAFHDLLERDDGAAKWSSLEVLNFRWRRESVSEKFYLDEVRLLDMLSTSDVNPLFQPVSWGVRLGAFQNGEDLSHSSLLLQAKVGNGIDILPWLVNEDESWLRWNLFAKSSAQETPDLRYAPGVGAESFFLLSPKSNLRAQLGAEDLFYATGWESQVFQARALFEVAKKIELAAEVQQKVWISPSHFRSDSMDKSLRVQYQFLF